MARLDAERRLREADMLLFIYLYIHTCMFYLLYLCLS